MSLTLAPVQTQTLGFGLPQIGMSPYSSLGTMGMGTMVAPPPAPPPANTANISVPAPVQPTAVSSVVNPAATVEPPVDPAAQQGWFSKIGGMEGIGTIIDGIGDLGSIYASLKQLGMAREQLALSRDAYQTNLANQTQSYNTALEDRTRARASATGASEAQIDSYLKKHSL